LRKFNLNFFKLCFGINGTLNNRFEYLRTHFFLNKKFELSKFNNLREPLLLFKIKKFTIKLFRKLFRRYRLNNLRRPVRIFFILLKKNARVFKLRRHTDILRFLNINHLRKPKDFIF
jgi:hypothetical protein